MPRPRPPKLSKWPADWPQPSGKPRDFPITTRELAMKVEVIEYRGEYRGHRFCVTYTRIQEGWSAECIYRNETWVYKKTASSPSMSNATARVRNIASEMSNSGVAGEAET